MSKKNLRGYSLIELMLVVAIIGILTVIAIPSYQNYTKRARFAEIIAATEPFKLAIAIALQNGASTADLTNGKLGIPEGSTATKNLANIKVDNGVITATGTALVENKTYILLPDENGSTWGVAGTFIDAGICNA